MALQKGFLQSKLASKISVFQFLVGIGLGLLFSFSLYALQYVTREIFRVFSLSEEGDFWIFSDAEVSFYNLIFAFLAVIFGQSVSINYLFNKASGSFNTSSRRIKDIVHEQRFFNWYFMAWFSKLALSYMAVFGFAGSGWFYLNSFYPNYNYLFVLIIIVLFLQTWNSLLRTFRRKAFKWMFFSAIAVSLISFGMSRINIIDYQNLNRVLTSESVDVKYKLELPTAAISDTIVRRFGAQPPIISLVLPKNSDLLDPQPILLMGTQEIFFEELTIEFVIETQKPHHVGMYGQPVFLAIDKDVPMRYVHRLWESLAMADVDYLQLKLVPKSSDLDVKYHLFYGKTSLFHYNPSHNESSYESRSQEIKNYKNLIEIKILKDGYLINNQKCTASVLKSELKRRINSNWDYAVSYSYSEDLSYSHYLEAFAAMKEAIRDFRDVESIRLYKKNFNQLCVSYNSRELQREITTKYPLRILNVSPDLKHFNAQLVPGRMFLKELDDK